tara:strand:- start:161 stop:535 length:375 start_codon:yes stop_codon:yes gene_type:complete
MIWKAIKGMFTATDTIKSIENVAMEWIETDKEAAEAKTLLLKTLDPNGQMRRELSRKISALYIYYVLVTSTLYLVVMFDIGDTGKPALAAAQGLGNLFEPISLLFGVVVTTSFGVSYANVKKGI